MTYDILTIQSNSPPRGWRYDPESWLLLCPFCKSVDTCDGWDDMGLPEGIRQCHACGQLCRPAQVSRVATEQMEMFE